MIEIKKAHSATRGIKHWGLGSMPSASLESKVLIG